MLFKSCADMHASAAAVLVFLWRRSASLGLPLRKKARDTSALGFSSFLQEKIYFLAVRGLCLSVCGQWGTACRGPRASHRGGLP